MLTAVARTAAEDGDSWKVVVPLIATAIAFAGVMIVVAALMARSGGRRRDGTRRGGHGRRARGLRGRATGHARARRQRVTGESLIGREVCRQRTASRICFGGKPFRRKGNLFGDVQRGEELAAQCLACHSVDGSTMVGPTWQGLFGKTEELEGGEGNPDRRKPVLVNRNAPPQIAFDQAAAQPRDEQARHAVRPHSVEHDP